MQEVPSDERTIAVMRVADGEPISTGWTRGRIVFVYLKRHTEITINTSDERHIKISLRITKTYMWIYPYRVKAKIGRERFVSFVA